MITTENQEAPFDFSKYLATPEQLKMPIEENKSSEPFDLKKYIVKEPETNFQAGVRHVTRSASRAVETLGGFAGDAVQLIKTGAEYLPEVPFTNFLPKSEPNFVQKAGKYALESLPTTESLKEKSQQLTNDYTKAKSPNENLSDEVVSLGTILLNPEKALTGLTPLVKQMGIGLLKSVGVKGAGIGAELLGADERTKTAVELGTLFLTGLADKKLADKFVGEQYKQARSKIPTGTMINTNNLENTLISVENQLSKGISTSTKKEVLNSLTELKGKASGGAMEIDEIVQSLHDINEKINSKKLFDELTSSERRLLKSRYDLLKNEVHQEIANYGKHNPEFYKQWSEANKSYQTIAKSKHISNFLQSKLGKLPKHLIGSVALDVFLGKPAASIGVIGSYSAIKTYEFLNRVANDKNLRNHYLKVILEATNENLPATIKNLNSLDKALKVKD